MERWGLGYSFQLGCTTVIAGHWRSRGSKSIFNCLFSGVDKSAVVFVPDKTNNRLIQSLEWKVVKIPCEKVIWLVNIKGREGRGIMVGLDIALADNSTNRNVGTLHNEIEGVGVGSLPLDCARPRL